MCSLLFSYTVGSIDISKNEISSISFVEIPKVEGELVGALTSSTTSVVINCATDVTFQRFHALVDMNTNAILVKAIDVTQIISTSTTAVVVNVATAFVWNIAASTSVVTIGSSSLTAAKVTSASHSGATTSISIITEDTRMKLDSKIKLNVASVIVTNDNIIDAVNTDGTCSYIGLANSFTSCNLGSFYESRCKDCSLGKFLTNTSILTRTCDSCMPGKIASRVKMTKW